MNRTRLALILCAIVVVGCVTTAYKTLYTVQTTTTSAVDSYYSLVIKGALPTNDVPAVATRYNLFQASFKIALDAAQFNTNALAPSSLQVESQDLINLINTIKKGAK